jgi:surface polysaccharide O-acyltransferase-like enzyme
MLMTQKQPSELMLMKSFAFLAVVFQSSIIFTMKQASPEESIMLGMLFNFVKFSAPVFVFLAGFHLFQQKPPIDYRTYVSHKGKELLLPYLVWSFIYLMMFSNEDEFVMLIKQIVIGDAAPHLWYVIMIIQFHLLAPLLLIMFSWAEKMIRSWKKATLILASLYLLLLFILSKWLSHSSVYLFHYMDRSFLSYFFYFFLGGVTARTLPRWRSFVMKSIPINSFIFVALFILVGYELISYKSIYSIDLKASTYLKPSMFLYVSSEILLLYSLSITIVQTKSLLYNALRFISQYTYGAYLGHIFFLHLFGKMINISVLSLLQSVILFFITVVSSILFCYVIHSLPISKWVIGLEQEQKCSFEQLLQLIFPKMLKTKK